MDSLRLVNERFPQISPDIRAQIVGNLAHGLTLIEAVRLTLDRVVSRSVAVGYPNPVAAEELRAVLAELGLDKRK